MSDLHDDIASHADRSERYAMSPEAAPSVGDTEIPRAAPSRRAAHAFDLARFATWLPRLGAVLWLDRRTRRTPPMRATIGQSGLLLLDHPALHALGRCTLATAHTQVTSHGPREWLCFRDADGEALTKLFLLPDTDYLAWDEMTAAAQLAPATQETACWQAHAAFLRHAFARLGPHWQARLLTFEHHRMPWLQTLDARPPLRLSLLGLEIAQLIARSEGAEFLAPLHAY